MMYDMDETCELCKMITDESVEKIYHDEDIVAFEGDHPDTPIHFIIAPRRHIESMSYIEPGDEVLLGRLLWVASLLAMQHRIDQKGYRIVINTNKEGGQSYPHLHVHLYGGKDFTVKPHIE